MKEHYILPKLTVQILFAVFIYLTLNSCQQNEEITLHKSKDPEVLYLTESSALQNVVSKLNTTLTAKNNTALLVDVDFDKALKRYDDELEIMYYTFSMRSNGQTLRKFVLRENSSGEILGHAFEFESDADWLEDKEAVVNWETFTGQFRVLALDGAIIAETEMVNGSTAASNKGGLASRTTGCTATFTDNFYCYGNNTSNPYSNSNCDYVGTTVNTSCSWESGMEFWVGGDNGSYNQQFGLERIDFDEMNNSNQNTRLDDNVKNYLSGKAKCVFEKLESINGNLFKKTIGAFIDDPNYHLTFKLGNCATTDDACTDSRDLNNIIILIENDNTNPLQIAQYILHEAIHAELYRYVSQYESGVDPNKRERLFQLYKFYYDRYGIGDIQHVYMTENYVKPLAAALRQLDGNRYPLDYYKAFAWDGLRAWDANGLLNMQMNSQYEQFRSTVIQNTQIPCN